MDGNNAPVLVEVTRGPLVECRHRGQVAVVDASGEVRAQAGDPQVPVCLRSLAKPFQALPLITTGAAAALGLRPDELAIMSGSLSGQDFQVELVIGILARLGLTPAALRCGAHPPLHRDTAKAMTQAGERPSPLHHTCAGKHASMLALCVHHGWPVDGYLEFDHPVQQLIKRTVGEMLGLPPEEIPTALDGCGAPVFFAPLRHIAHGFARLAAADPQSPHGQLHAALLAHPRHLAGDGRLETVIMETLPGKVMAKTGAEGGFALTVPAAGLGVALKIEDGAGRALGPAILRVLRELELLTPESEKTLTPYARPRLLNHRKQEVGEIRAVFSLS